MQTKQQLQLLLQQAGTTPNKQLGQHFLIDLNLMRLLIERADISSDDVVLEVGSGTGSLTEAIAEKAGSLIAVEYDDALAQTAQSRLADKSNVTVINTDALRTKNALDEKVLFEIEAKRKVLGGRFKLVANLPYNISSPIMIILCIGPTPADQMHVTVQKEVARRMVAEPGSKDYGTLSIFLGATGTVEIVRVLKPAVFWPQPKVDSAIVSYFRQRHKMEAIKDIRLFQELVNLFMQHRRKTLWSTTKFAAGRLTRIKDWKAIFKKADIAPSSRAEKLKPETFVRLANIIKQTL